MLALLFKNFWIVILVILGLVFLKQVPTEKVENQSYEYLLNNMNKIVKSSGIKKSSEKIINSYNNNFIDINQCHSLFHYLGHKAYELNPDKWDFLVSTDSGLCMYGYEHGIEAQIALEENASADSMNKKLRTYCQKLNLKFGGIECYHGLGHALIQSKYPISIALKMCDRLVSTTNENPNECYRGAFSEYVNVLRGIDGDTDAPIPGAVPIQIGIPKTYEFCLGMDKKYQNACVSQYTTFLYTGDLDRSLFRCNNFNSWVGEICSYKVTQSYISTNQSKEEIQSPPNVLIHLNVYVRRGYIKGVVTNYGQYHDDRLIQKISEWCRKLTLSGDVNYCVSQL